eukprot:TRINITY_DN2831_c0_g1_i1.p1 TRINITY_DN2831_c0_g1~~TRINITY_DN2831_c0_g1_i1.p1  ORF type:complete len:1476 (-),score=229.01 TRINITY_DN2831_c0_g1_i1:1265-5692(-)
MDDIGEPIEAFPEFFSCAARAPVALPNAQVSENHGNLLACSSRFGYAIIASNVTLSVVKLAHIHEAKTQATDVNLSGLGVQSILSIQFIMGDTILLVHTESNGAQLFFLRLSALVSAEVQMFTKPIAAITYGAFSESNPVTTPSTQLVATLTSAVQIHSISNTLCEPTVKIDVSGPLSLAFSPSDALLAVGTQRGCVYLYFTSNGSLAATIVEVESGWVPFAIHFVREDAVLVTYSKDENIRYIMWTLDMNDKAVRVASHFPFGELCLPSPDVSSDQHPNVAFNTISSWDMCIISSSISTEAEIIAKVENEWQVWKLDESKSVYLPINEDGDDTFPLGSALDFTDVNLIEPEDPSSDKIQPMPRYLVLTSEFKILPYSLTDARAGAKCDLIRHPSALPQTPKPEKPVERITFPDFSRPNLSSESPGVAKSIRSSPETHQAAERKEKNQLITEISGSSQASVDFNKTEKASAGDRSTKGTSESETEWTKTTSTTEMSLAAKPLEFRSHSILKPGVVKISPDMGFKEAKGPLETTPLDTSSVRDGSERSAYHSSVLKIPTRQAFSGTGEFLSQFYTEKSGEGVQYHRTSIETIQNEQKTESESSIERKPELLARTEPESVSLRPSLDQAFIIASSGEAIDLIQSILCEMSEELTTNRKAGAVLTSELKSQSHSILSRLDATRSALGEMIEDTMTRFHRESVLRREVSEALVHMLRISRAYETLALEVQVEDATGLSRSLKPEDIAIDEQISNKEAEIVKSMASIEERLAEEAAPKKYKNSSDVVREIYSSLSLQGIRIRRVLELLTSLTQRLEEHDQGGRQSSLGLSLARLEQLSLDENKSSCTLKMDSEHMSTTGTMQKLTNIKENMVNSSKTPDENHELFPTNIDALLRKLAMSGGREQIGPLGPKLRADTKLAQKKEASSREFHKDVILPSHEKRGESQMTEVKNLLEAVNHLRTQATVETGRFPTSNILGVTTLPSERDFESFQKKLPPRTTVKDEEDEIQSFPELSHSLSSLGVVTQNISNRSKEPDDFGTTEKTSKKTEVQFASLPPDEDEVLTKQNRDYSGQEQSDIKEKGLQLTESSADEGKKSGNARQTVIEDSVHWEPPSVVVESSPFESTQISEPDTTKPGFGRSHTIHSVEKPKPDSATTDSLLLGNIKSHNGDALSSSPFGRVSNQEEDKGNNVFGMTGLLATTGEAFVSSSFQSPQSVSNQAGTSIFGAAMQTNVPNDSSRSGDGGSPIAATESEDSDDENLRQGMDTTMDASQSNKSHGFSGQSSAGGSLFGQAFSAAFGTPTSGPQIFGQSSSQVRSSAGGPQMNAVTGSFGTPDTTPMGIGSALNNPTFSATPSFGMASRIGEAPVFGAPSAIGETATFGNASPFGARGSPFAMPSPRFGESSFGNQTAQSSSMLGFGVSSASTGSASPFGTLATGTGFGQSSGSVSGFAALAGSSNGLVFGSGGGPPAFTSAAFTQRRA